MEKKAVCKQKYPVPGGGWLQCELTREHEGTCGQLPPQESNTIHHVVDVEHMALRPHLRKDWMPTREGMVDDALRYARMRSEDGQDAADAWWEKKDEKRGKVAS